jgi:hypothetical protein
MRRAGTPGGRVPFRQWGPRADATWQRTVAPQAGYLAVACGVFGLNGNELV